MITTKRKPIQRPADVGPEVRLLRVLESGAVKRCPICMREWPAEAIVREDGNERCPTCAGLKTNEYKARQLAIESQYAASREPPPQISQAKLSTTFPGTIVKITDANSIRIYEGSPLSLVRNVAKTVLLKGRSFSASDTYTGTGLTISLSAQTAVLTTLSITAALSMTPGPASLTFNSIIFRNIFSVR